MKCGSNDNFKEGPDHKFSMNFDTWKDMVDRTRELEKSLGTEIKKIEDNEIETVVLQRRAIRVKKDLSVGDIIGEKDLEFLRPCPTDAIPPYELEKVIGKKLIKNIKSGDCLKWTNIK